MDNELKYIVFYCELGEDLFGIEICSQPPRMISDGVIDGLKSAVTRLRRSGVAETHISSIDLTRNDEIGAAFQIIPNSGALKGNHTIENVARQVANALNPCNQVEVSVREAPERLDHPA